MWAMYKLGARSYFYWGATNWQDEESGTPLRDVYENAWTFGTRNQDDCAGVCSGYGGAGGAPGCALDSECDTGYTCGGYPTNDCYNGGAGGIDG